MEYLVLLPNKIVAFAADIFNDGEMMTNGKQK
jgi:hypothetical protein